MNLEELRKSMESEATIENKKLRGRISELELELQRERNDFSQTNEALLSVCQALSNRCFALTHGVMCSFCRLSGFRCEQTLSKK